MTGTLAVGRTVGADQYLADAAAGAQAVRDVASAVAALPARATPASLKAMAGDLTEPIRQAEGASQRLSAMRLEDQRLESQRAQSATAYTQVLAAMRRLQSAARSGEPEAARKAAVDLDAAVQQLTQIRRTGD